MHTKTANFFRLRENWSDRRTKFSGKKFQSEEKKNIYMSFLQQVDKRPCSELLHGGGGVHLNYFWGTNSKQNHKRR